MILFIDTHAELITVALKTKDNLFIKTKESEYSHSIYTMPMIEELFKENNLNVKDLKKIIVVNGPGSFTGIRIGVSIAKTMAYALKIDINTISSLTAYLISSDLNENKKAVIEDNKGYTETDPIQNMETKYSFDNEEGSIIIDLKNDKK